jgi:hypothetical protein
MTAVFYESKALESAWQLLPGGPDCENHNEVWQYMGSTYLGDGAAVHTFRHRWHPSTDQRMYVKIREDERGPVLA